MRAITVLAGRNNVGKSNFLRFLREHYDDTVESLANPTAQSFSWADGDERPLGTGDELTSFAVACEVTTDANLEWVSALTTSGYQAPRGMATTLGEDDGRALLTEVEGVLEETYGGPRIVWSRDQRNKAPETGLAEELVKALRAEGRLHRYLTHLSRNAQQGAQILARQLESSALVPLQNRPVFVPAFRQIKNAGEQSWDGAGLIPMLADLRDPDLGPARRRKQERWAKFLGFVREVLEDPAIDVSVPPSSPRLIVEMNRRELDVNDLGHGIHEVIILAAAATAHENTLFLLEEPEIHVHPLLQRRILRYLSETEGNQFVIATHSAHFLDHPQASVFRVSLAEAWTQVAPVSTNSELVTTARDLGYRPSDLLQANAVVWVEGPSDRIYLKHWLMKAAPELREGVDYSIMFYGGRLAAHLSGQDGKFVMATEQLIELRRINRFSAIVMDSDRTKKGQHTKRGTTKGRLRDEFGDAPGYAWITEGREIENYVDPGVMLQAIQSIDPRASKLVSVDDYEHRWKYRRAGSSRIIHANKVELARAVVALDPGLEVMRLKSAIGGLVSMIREAGGPGVSVG